MRIANSDMFLRIDADSPDFTIVPISQLGFRASDNDAMRSGASRRRISIRRSEASQALLS